MPPFSFAGGEHRTTLLGAESTDYPQVVLE